MALKILLVAEGYSEFLIQFEKCSSKPNLILKSVSHCAMKLKNYQKIVSIFSRHFLPVDTIQQNDTEQNET
jgi:hypothetical protein